MGRRWLLLVRSRVVLNARQHEPRQQVEQLGLCPGNACGCCVGVSVHRTAISRESRRSFRGHCDHLKGIENTAGVGGWYGQPTPRQRCGDIRNKVRPPSDGGGQSFGGAADADVNRRRRPNRCSAPTDRGRRHPPRVGAASMSQRPADRRWRPPARGETRGAAPKRSFRPGLPPRRQETVNQCEKTSAYSFPLRGARKSR